jgi:UDP-GlcNAc:undecaprenyl-phosphate/decaprenyl-phosphate GlcNAc-1-phosphate transferase
VRFIPDVGLYLPLAVGAMAVAAVIAFALTPLVRHLALRTGVVDRPNYRRVNTTPVPRGGGLAVMAAFIVVAGVLAVLDAGTLVRRPVFLYQDEVIALLGGGLVAAALGAVDDYFDLRARWQFSAQLTLAIFAVVLGITVAAVNNPFGPGLLIFPGLFAAGFTIVWIIGMINSINFIDGLDGLSSGIALIAAVTLGVISLTPQIGQPYVAVLCFALAGALLGFLRWNFNPASIFLGTSGVMFVGYTLALLAILGTAKVAVALLVLAIPVIDTFWIIVRRLLARRSPFTPDRGHIHHRLLDLGLTHRQTVLLIYAICGALGVLSLVLSVANQVYAFVGVLLGFGLLLFALTRGAAHDALEAQSYEGPEAGADARPGAPPGAGERHAAKVARVADGAVAADGDGDLGEGQRDPVTPPG